MCIAVEIQESHYLSGSTTAEFSEIVHWVCKSAEKRHKVKRFIFMELLI
jgi:hypothetical protein